MLRNLFTKRARSVKMAKTKIRKYAQPLWRKAVQNIDVPLVVVVLSVLRFCLKLSKDTP